MNYEQADQRLHVNYDRNLRELSSRKVGNNTYLERGHEGVITLRLHRTRIIAWHPNGVTYVDMGGWDSVTTRARLNEYMPHGVELFTKSTHTFVWTRNNTTYYLPNGRFTIHTDGTLWDGVRPQSEGLEKVAEHQREVRQRGYARAKVRRAEVKARKQWQATFNVFGWAFLGKVAYNEANRVQRWLAHFNLPVDNDGFTWLYKNVHVMPDGSRRSAHTASGPADHCVWVERGTVDDRAVWDGQARCGNGLHASATRSHASAYVTAWSAMGHLRIKVKASEIVLIGSWRYSIDKCKVPYVYDIVTGDVVPSDRPSESTIAP